MIDGKEVDRLLGYPGDQFFYPMLRVMMWRAGLLMTPPKQQPESTTHEQYC